MTNEIVKEKVKAFLGKKVFVKVNTGRKKYEYYEGIVENIYPYLFTLKTDSEIKSFSYSDILTKNVIIKLI